MRRDVVAKINSDLLERLTRKLGVSKKRVYARIQEISTNNLVPRHLGALLLARENGINVQKFASAQELLELRTAPQQSPPLAQEAHKRNSTRMPKAARKPKTKENTVYVVHGRDSNLRGSMYDLLRALGLKPQEWGHAIRAAVKGSGGNPYVNDVVTKIMQEAQAIVVILSPDDEVRLKKAFVGEDELQTEGTLRGQARPNVIFETGIAVGTHHRKTIVVQMGDVKQFTDIAGMHILRLTGSPESRRDFATRLEALGCTVDRDGDHWLRVGDFAPTSSPRNKVKRSGVLGR